MLTDFDVDSSEIRPTFEERCTKCGGSGNWRSYSGWTTRTCYACKGKGYFTRLTSPEVRAKAKVQRTARAAANANSVWDSFSAEHPAVAQWMVDSTGFEFADSLRAAVIRFGQLTDRQLAAAESCVAKREAAKAAAADRKANAPVVSVEKIETAIQTALTNGLKRPILRLAGFRFSPAKATSTNAGAIYVKSVDGVYLGKVLGGKLFASRDCNADQSAEIISVCTDPEAAAVAYGKQFGQCACCGRELSDPESVERGIGPVCAEKFGW